MKSPKSSTSAAAAAALAPARFCFGDGEKVIGLEGDEDESGFSSEARLPAEIGRGGVLSRAGRSWPVGASVSLAEVTVGGAGLADAAVPVPGAL